MTPTPVGMRCPDCARSDAGADAALDGGRPMATYVLIARQRGHLLRGAVERADGATSTCRRRRSVANGDFWRLVTNGFMHDPSNIFHRLLNMYALFWLGRMIEPALGHARFLGIYFAVAAVRVAGRAAARAGRRALGASGAIFGLFGRGARDGPQPQHRA